MSKEKETKEEMYVEDAFEDDIQEELIDSETGEIEMSNREHLKGIHRNNVRWWKKHWKGVAIGGLSVLATLGIAAAILTGQDVDVDKSPFDKPDDSNDPMDKMYNDDGSMDIPVDGGTIHMEFNENETVNNVEVG